jgi:hypothetical protein
VRQRTDAVYEKCFHDPQASVPRRQKIRFLTGELYCTKTGDPGYPAVAGTCM